MQTIRQMFSPGRVLLNLRQRVFHVKHLKSMLAPVCQVVPSASHATHLTNRPTCIFIAIAPTGCWVAASFAAQLQHLVHLGLGPPQNAVCGLLVQGLVELGEFSGACLQELLSRRKALLCKSNITELQLSSCQSHCHLLRAIVAAGFLGQLFDERCHTPHLGGRHHLKLWRLSCRGTFEMLKLQAFHFVLDFVSLVEGL